MRSVKLYFLLLFNLAAHNLYSQYYGENNFSYQAGIGIGMMNSITDLGGASQETTTYLNEIQRKNWNFSPSIYAGIMFRDFVGVHLQGTIGMVEAADSTITGKTGNLISKNIRNLSFRSRIAEIALTAELHPLTAVNFEIFPYFSPYVIGGIGFFSFNPQAQYQGRWIDLQPLRLEGQGFDEYPDRKVYNLTGFNLQFGIGVRYDISNFLNARVEFLHRKLSTDYLDDASTKEYINPNLFSKYLSPQQAALARALYNRTKDGSIPIFRGNVRENDAYMTLSVKLGFSLARQDAGSRSRNRQLKCFF